MLLTIINRDSSPQLKFKPSLPIAFITTRVVMDTSPYHYQYSIIFAWLLCAVMLNRGLCSFCNQKDQHALLNFKQGAVDPSGLLSSWSTDQDCCQWKGVKCDNFTHRVIELSLPCSTTPPTYTDKVDKSHCLTGSIYLSLLEFEFLNHLDLSNNDFLSLQFDSVDSHNISEATPPHQCVNSSILHYLDLSDNDNLVINDLQWLSCVSSLEHLYLGSIDLHKETNWLQLVTMLPSLSELYLYDCQLKDLSPSLQYANFTSLKVLDLSENDFDSELPKWLFNLSSALTEISLRYNLLRGELPKALLNLGLLESLDLRHNNFNGPIPNWLGQFEHLQYLLLSANLFSGPIPSNLGNLSSLVSLFIQANQATGVVSERNFAKLSKLKFLNMISSPPLFFDFDSHWVPPFQLTQLSFKFAGPKLPTWFYTQRTLDYLTILDSSFEAPSDFWNFVSRMSFLYLKGNLIDENMSNVLLNSEYIIFSSNYLKGGLPQLSSNVSVAVISNNSLSGTISPLLCDHKMLNGKANLMYLDISHNQLSGGLTNCWKNWNSLVHINLGSNNLTGKIPPSMGLLSNLTSLHLHENKLYGEVPHSLQNCHSLLVFNVRENNFSGNIPIWIPQRAKALQLRSNQFYGNIPLQICQMSSLIILDIGDNKISGHIPSCLSNITTLVFNNASMNQLTFFFRFSGSSAYFYLEDNLQLVTKGQGSQYGKNLHFMTLIDLSNNDLSGIIPPQLFVLVGLNSLNLSYNKLQGKIPQVIGNMKNLESLDVSTNQLWGEIPQSMSNLAFLSYLNLSFNNFTGKIPSGTQLQGFNALSYIGNPYLCGPPLTQNCSKGGNYKDTGPVDQDNDEDEFLSWFHIGIESGIVTGFLGVCGITFLNRKCKHEHLKFLCDLSY